MHATKMQHIKHDNAKCFVHGLKLDMTNDDSTVDGLMSVTQGWSERGFIKGVFVILGMGVLLPWNALSLPSPTFQQDCAQKRSLYLWCLHGICQ
jgi:hypothetical protein